MLETIAPEDLGGLVGLNGDMPPTIIWCPIAIAAAATGSEPHARALIPLLSPLRERACIQIPATAFLGPISLIVASLRDLVGDDEGAAHDYEHSVRWSEQIGATTAAAIALHALAAHHHRRSEPTVAADLESRARRLVSSFDLATAPMTRAHTRHPAGRR